MKKKEELSLEEQVVRIRQKRARKMDKEALKKYLNIAFLTLAAIGVIWYYTDTNHHLYALTVIGISLVIKMVEFFIRFVL